MNERPKDPYVYLKCKNCENIFRVVKSGVGLHSIVDDIGEIFYRAYCSRCSLTECERTTKSEWIKSNEVKPDNAK